MNFRLLILAAGCAMFGSIAGDLRYGFVALALVGPIVWTLTKIESYLNNVTSNRTVLNAAEVVQAVRDAERKANMARR